MSDRRRLLASTAHVVISGSSMGGKSGGSGSEQPDNLKSTQVAKVIDLISEGPTRGLIDGMKSVIVDGTRLRNQSGSMNFQNVIIQEVNGWPNQQIMQGFSFQQNEQAVQTQLMAGFPQTRTILNGDVDRCRVTVSVPSLQSITDKGDIKGTDVKFAVYIQYNGGGFNKIGDYTISGKTTSRYQRAIMFPLKKGAAPFDIRVVRTTPDSKSNKLQNELYWDSYTEIIDDRINYNLSACIGVQVSAEQFSSIPKRSYEYDGLIVQIPDNYDPDAGTYDGVWSGDFKYDWTNNPAWVLYDLLTNSRYGLGQYVSSTMIDKWSFYKVAQWCDQRVANGRGGTERRWICNCQIFTQQEAYDLLQQFAGIFRGFTYWNGSQMVAIADQPSDPVVQFTNANVIDGSFQYSSSDIRSRHTQINVGWNDPNLLGQKRYAVVEDQEAISKYGIQPLDVDGLGCTTESQAIRLGKWQLYTELYESEAVQFQAGLETTWVRPGDIIRVLDANISGKRWGGRVGSTTTASIIQFDSEVPLSGGVTYDLFCVIGEGGIERRSQIMAPVDGDYSSVTLVSPFSAAPAAGTVWVMQDPGDLEATLWRVTPVRQSEADRYEVNAVRHYPDKWDYVEKGIALSEPTISDIPVLLDAVSDVQLIEYLTPISPISVAVYATVSWVSSAPRFQVSWRRSDTNENWQTITSELKAVDLQVSEGTWEFQITPISPIGLKGTTYTFKKEIIGRYALPSTPTNFRVSIIDGVASFSWDATTDVDVVIGGRFELRHTINQTDATWNGAQTIIEAIPGRATTVETGYRTGTWMLKAFDMDGRESPNAAMIIAGEPDGRFENFFRIEESPDYLGSKSNTEILLPQEWLIIGATGGYWDSQTDNIDDWPDVDDLPVPVDEEEPPPFGTYKFDNRIDMGGVFGVSFATDVLAFPYMDGGNDVDSRLQNVDSWPSWDDESGDLTGKVTIMVRQTPDNPASPTAEWSDWEKLTAGEYVNRGFEFRADLSASLGQNIGVERLAITADVRNKIDAGEDVPYPAATTRVYYATKFYTVPAVVVTIQDAGTTDVWQILNKTREYFDIEIKNSGGAHQTRTFDWHAQGY